MHGGTAAKPRPIGVLRLALGLAVCALYVVAWFGLAGGYDWTAAWVFLALLTVSQSVSAVWIRRRNPELLAHRGRLGKGTKAWDIAWLLVFFATYTAMLFVAATDAGRRPWAELFPWPWVAGAVVYLAALPLITAAMAVNPHFEKTVRIQSERGHRVIDTGPYAIIRHPGYAALIPGFALAPPLLLGSWLALAVAAALVVEIVIRTSLEDRTLRLELTGYDDYARRVRWRLVPGLW